MCMDVCEVHFNIVWVKVKEQIGKFALLAATAFSLVLSSQLFAFEKVPLQ